MWTLFSVYYLTLLTLYLLQVSTDGRTVRDELVSALSDAMFLAPGLHSAGTFSRRRNNTFFYQFSHQTKSGMYAEVTITTQF